MASDRKELVIWAAGFFDGEGSIFLRKVKKSYAVRIAVGQVNPAPIRVLKELFGGHISLQKSKKYKDQWKWEQDAKSAIITLEELLPYLKVKDNVAAIALDFQKLKRKGRKMTTQDQSLEQEFKEKISYLNRRD